VVASPWSRAVEKGIPPKYRVDYAGPRQVGIGDSATSPITRSVATSAMSRHRRSRESGQLPIPELGMRFSALALCQRPELRPVGHRTAP